jgi:DNA repair protein RecO (recombination protein O)
MSLYRCEGVVLRTYKLGEADRIISLVTNTQGKVRGVAKGVRKTKSRIGARLEPLSHVSLLMYTGRGDLDIVSQAESIESFRVVREDLDRLTKATALLEAIDHVSVEGQHDERLFKMLLGGLRSLNEVNAPMLVGAFYWKLLSHEGYEPSLDACVRCSSVVDLVGFDAAAGGVTCKSCSLGARVSPNALALLHRVLGGQLNAALREPESAAVHEVERLGTVALEHVLERRLKAGRLLDHA